MKIYRQQTIWDNVPLEVAQFKKSLHAGSVIMPLAYAGYGTRHYRLTIRREFLRDHHIDGKALLRLLPAWAKPNFGPKNIGAKVTAFYAQNSKVITDMSGPWVGSEAWHEAQELLPDPFRGTRQYLESKYARAAA